MGQLAAWGLSTMCCQLLGIFPGVFFFPFPSLRGNLRPSQSQVRTLTVTRPPEACLNSDRGTVCGNGWTEKPQSWEGPAEQERPWVDTPSPQQRGNVQMRRNGQSGGPPQNLEISDALYLHEPGWPFVRLASWLNMG